jgi:DNA-directed RNA polymerase III subunit RPC6
MNRCLKTLEQRSLIKIIKSVKYPTRKIYMLASLTPSDDITGGPWFTDSELDGEFISTLLNMLERFITAKSFHHAPHKSLAKRRKSMTKAEVDSALHAAHIQRNDKRGANLLPFPHDYQGYPSLEEITKWVAKSNVISSGTVLQTQDISQLLQVLCFDGRVEKISGGLSGVVYKAVRPEAVLKGENSGNGFTETPCGRCPVFNLCEEGGPVSASNCVYFNKWLDIDGEIM